MVALNSAFRDLDVCPSHKEKPATLGVPHCAAHQDGVRVPARNYASFCARVESAQVHDASAVPAQLDTGFNAVVDLALCDGRRGEAVDKDPAVPVVVSTSTS